MAVGDVVSFRVRHNMPPGHLNPGLTSQAITGMFTPLQEMGGFQCCPYLFPSLALYHADQLGKDISLRGKCQRAKQGLGWPGLQGSAQEVMCERGRPMLPSHLVHSSTL